MSLASRQTRDTDGDEVYASSHASAIRRRPMPTFLNASVQKILHDSTSLSNDFSSCASQNGVKAGNHPQPRPKPQPHLQPEYEVDSGGCLQQQLSTVLCIYYTSRGRSGRGLCYTTCLPIAAGGRSRRQLNNYGDPSQLPGATNIDCRLYCISHFQKPTSIHTCNRPMETYVCERYNG